MLGHTLIVRTRSRSPHPHDRGKGKAITQHRRRRDPGDTNRPMVVVRGRIASTRCPDAIGAPVAAGFGVYPYRRDAARAFPSDDKCMGWRYDLVVSAAVPTMT